MKWKITENIISDEIKKGTVDNLLLAAVIIFFPALIVSLIRIEFTGWQLAYTYQTIIFFSAVAVYAFRKRLSVSFKLFVIQFSVFVIAISGLLTFGYLGSAHLFFILIPIFFWFFSKPIFAIGATIICVAIFSLFGYLYVSGYLSIDFDVNEYINRGVTWATYGFVMLAIMSFCIVMFNKLFRAQEKSYSLITESERRHRLLANNINDIIWILDFESKKYVYVSPSIRKTLGYQPEEFIETDFSSLMPAHSVKALAEYLQRGLEDFKLDRSPDQHTYEQEVYHKKGHTVWIETSTQYIRNEITQQIEIVGASREITDRKRAQYALEKSDERYKLATGASNMGIWDWYPHSDVVYFSDMWKQQIGYKSNELESKFSTWNEHLHPDERAATLKRLEDYLASPVGKYIVEFRFRHKAGHYIWIHCRAETILDESGKVKRLYGTHQDITRLRMNEENLIEKNRMLEKINSELDNFVYRVSHDIRAPLSSCFGILNLIEKENLINSNNQFYFNLLRDVLSKQELVIKSILEYSRNSRGELSNGEIKLKEMILSTFSDIKFMNDSTGKVELEVHLEEGFSFSCDRHRIQFILNNLISNAIKYADLNKARPLISVFAEQDEKEVKITVRDNGIGMSAEVLPHIFEMFYRGNDNKSTGSGLGLYIVHETVEKLRGKIQVTSEFEKFTSFVVTLPLTQEDSLNEVKGNNLVIDI